MSNSHFCAKSQLYRSRVTEHGTHDLMVRMVRTLRTVRTVRMTAWYARYARSARSASFQTQLMIKELINLRNQEVSIYEH